MGSPVLVAVAFPRPISREDFDLKVGVSADLLATASEELFKVIDVLAVAVGEGRQATVLLLALRRLLVSYSR